MVFLNSHFSPYRLALDPDCVYEELGRRGLVCRGPYRSLRALEQGAKAWVGTAEVLRPDLQLPLQLDALLQLVTLQQAESRHELHWPHRIQRITVNPTQSKIQ